MCIKCTLVSVLTFEREFGAFGSVLHLMESKQTPRLKCAHTGQLFKLPKSATQIDL